MHAVVVVERGSVFMMQQFCSVDGFCIEVVSSASTSIMRSIYYYRTHAHMYLFEFKRNEILFVGLVNQPDSNSNDFHFFFFVILSNGIGVK